MGNVIGIERKRMRQRHVDNYFRTMREVERDGKYISVLATVHTFYSGSDMEIQRAYNSALASGRKIVVYKKLGGPFAFVPAVGEGLENGDDGRGLNGAGGKGRKENPWL
jgi:hypothetical protein